MPTVRRPPPAPPGPLPRWWFYARPVSTHQLNALFLVLPRAERFMLAAVRPAMASLRPGDALRERVRAFCTQEALHAAEHSRAEALLAAQGFDLEPLTEIVARTFDRLQRWLSPRARLALTVGLEHYGAVMGAELLAGGHTAHTHPRLRSLLEWHAAEEVEHRAVTFDLWIATGGGWSGRVLGFLGATLLQARFRTALSRHLIAQDDAITPASFAENLAFQRRNPDRLRCLRRAWSTFLWPGFHPDSLDDDALVARFCAPSG